MAAVCVQWRRPVVRYLHRRRVIIDFIVCFLYVLWVGQDSVVGIATCYGLGGRIPVGSRYSSPVQTVPETHPTSCTPGNDSFCSGVNVWGVALTTHPHLVMWLKKGQSYVSALSLALGGLLQGDPYLYVLQIHAEKQLFCQIGVTQNRGTKTLLRNVFAPSVSCLY